MYYKKIGSTDINASVVALGTWSMGGDSNWGPAEDENSIRVIHTAIDMGINYFDTAPAYGFGHSEQVLKKALEGHRDKVYVATKCGLRCDETDETTYLHNQRDGITNRRNLSPASMRFELERSLQNLGTDYVDMYITHYQTMPGYEPSIEVTMTALESFRKEGLIRGIGASNITREQILEYTKYGTLDLVQNKYSMLDRDTQKEIVALCAEKKMAFQTFSPMERGILAGKIGLDTEISNRARQNNKWYERENRVKVLGMLDKMKPLCGKYSCDISSIVVAWTLAQNGSINLLCGSRKIEQIQANALGGGFVMDKEDIAAIDGYLSEVLA
ncbi:aldo/keto reductase [Synergistales bacterium]|nr:aldo/keto reductase [Synergistales bacterium]